MPKSLFRRTLLQALILFLAIASVTITTPATVTPAETPILDQVWQAQEPERPFILPFKEPSGPDTWLLGQTYDNTIGANFQPQHNLSIQPGYSLRHRSLSTLQK